MSSSTSSSLSRVSPMSICPLNTTARDWGAHQTLLAAGMSHTAFFTNQVVGRTFAWRLERLRAEYARALVHVRCMRSRGRQGCSARRAADAVAL